MTKLDKWVLTLLCLGILVLSALFVVGINKEYPGRTVLEFF